MATLEREIRRSDIRFIKRSPKAFVNPGHAIFNSFMPAFEIQTDKSRIFGFYPIQKESSTLQSKGYQRLIDLIMSLSPDVHSTSIVENNTCIHVVAKKGDYTYHFDLYEDEFNHSDPEIVFNPFWGDKKLKARMDNLSEIEYLLNTDFETVG
ncbi:MAG: hypothetical protein KA270_00930 [Saprospiraceae bacterium]|nr:hypothetical protein [Saprospiraceae bacterium]MBP6565693.1 hypothetical protein [Saprospiraceae bacterium]